MEEVKRINKRLVELYGLSLYNKPNYRLAWSEDLIEKRFKDEHIKYSESGLWLGIERNKVHELKKYEYIRDRWILEWYVPVQQAMNNEIKVGDGYECLFVFHKAKTQEYLKPAWFAVEYIIKRHQYILSRENPERRTEEMDQRDDDALLAREEAAFLDYLEQEQMTHFASKIRAGETILLPGKDF